MPIVNTTANIVSSASVRASDAPSDKLVQYQIASKFTVACDGLVLSVHMLADFVVPRRRLARLARFATEDGGGR